MSNVGYDVGSLKFFVDVQCPGNQLGANRKGSVHTNLTTIVAEIALKATAYATGLHVSDFLLKTSACLLVKPPHEPPHEVSPHEVIRASLIPTSRESGPPVRCGESAALSGGCQKGQRHGEPNLRRCRLNVRNQLPGLSPNFDMHNLPHTDGSENN